jgi:hypothetical protein
MVPLCPPARTIQDDYKPKNASIMCDITMLRPTTYLTELHDEIHEGSRRVSVTNVSSFLKQIGNGDVCLQRLVHCTLARTEINVNVFLDLWQT